MVEQRTRDIVLDLIVLSLLTVDSVNILQRNKHEK
jgi:hypothetical protein